MDHQLVLARIDVRNTVVMPLEVQAARRNGSFEQMQRRARGAGACASRRDGEAALYFLFPFGRHAVFGKRTAGRFHPGGRVAADTFVCTCRAQSSPSYTRRKQAAAEKRP